MSQEVINKKLKELFPDKFWLYVDSSPESQKIIKEAEPFREAGMLKVYDIYKDGGFNGSDVPLPRLLRNGDVMVGWGLHRFIQHLKELNEKFFREETLKEAK